MRIKVLYHGDWDGIVSAWLIDRYWGARVIDDMHVDYQPVQYGFPPPEGITDYDKVYIVDFSYPAEELDSIASRNKELIVIDHHKTAVAKLADWKPLGNTTAVLQVNRNGKQVAGCELVWHHLVETGDGCAPDDEMILPMLAQYVADRDVWRWELPSSKEVNACIRTYEQTIENCDLLFKRFTSSPQEVARIADEGAAVLRYQERVIADSVKHARPLSLPVLCEGKIIGERMGLAVNMPVSSLISEVAGALAEESFSAEHYPQLEGKPVEFGCCWFHGDEGWVYSLRSRSDVDVSEIAKGLGGGGHAKAAGFQSEHPPTQWAVELRVKVDR